MGEGDEVGSATEGDMTEPAKEGGDRHWCIRGIGARWRKTSAHDGWPSW